MHLELLVGISVKKKCEDYEVCEACDKVKDECKVCGKNRVYELLRTGMVGWPTIVFTRYHKRGRTRIRAHAYGTNGRLCKTILGYDANALYLYCSGGVLPCGKERFEKVKSPRCKRKM